MFLPFVKILLLFCTLSYFYYCYSYLFYYFFISIYLFFGEKTNSFSFKGLCVEFLLLGIPTVVSVGFEGSLGKL